MPRAAARPSRTMPRKPGSTGALLKRRGRFAAGHGGWPLIGTPDDVADGLEQLAAAGLDGSVFGFVDYNKELPYFEQEVLPRLQRKGMRIPREQKRQRA